MPLPIPLTQNQLASLRDFLEREGIGQAPVAKADGRWGNPKKSSGRYNTLFAFVHIPVVEVAVCVTIAKAVGDTVAKEAILQLARKVKKWMTADGKGVETVNILDAYGNVLKTVKRANRKG